jgi:hypothetical protein
MAPFRTHKHLSSWAGTCPGNNESAGKRKSGKTLKGNRWLRGALGEAAWAASHKKHTYLAAPFRRLAARRGKKRAIVALSHTLLVAIYHMLRRQAVYPELGADHFQRLDPERITRYHVGKLQALGHQVTLIPVESAA